MSVVCANVLERFPCFFCELFANLAGHVRSLSKNHLLQKDRNSRCVPCMRENLRDVLQPSCLNSCGRYSCRDQEAGHHTELDAFKTYFRKADLNPPNFASARKLVSSPSQAVCFWEEQKLGVRFPNLRLMRWEPCASTSGDRAEGWQQGARSLGKLRAAGARPFHKKTAEGRSFGWYK